MLTHKHLQTQANRFSHDCLLGLTEQERHRRRKATAQVPLLLRQGSMSSHSPSPYYNASVDDQAFDDACDLGQFCMNPCWFLFCKVSKLIENYNSTISKKQHQQNDGNIDDAEAWMVNNTSSSSSSTATGSSLPTTTNGKTLWYQQVLYVTLVYGTWCIIFWKVFPLFGSKTAILPYWSTLGMGTVLFVSCVTSYVIAKFSSPGIITTETITKYNNYPYDNVLYVQNDAICPTSGIIKLARSKYDKYKHYQHIPRYDHYCGWLNQAIGEENYRYFVTFLMIHTFMCWYGFVTVYITIWNEANLTNGFVVGNGGGDVSTMFQFRNLSSILVFDRYITVALTVLFVMSFLLTMFLGFHCFIICNGMTTNEYYKWKLVHERYNNASNHHNQTSSSSSSVVSSNIKNLYNLGFVANWYEVFFPRSLRYSYSSIAATSATIKSIKHL